MCSVPVLFLLNDVYTLLQGVFLFTRLLFSKRSKQLGSKQLGSKQLPCLQNKKNISSVSQKLIGAALESKVMITIEFNWCLYIRLCVLLS